MIYVVIYVVIEKCLVVSYSETVKESQHSSRPGLHDADVNGTPSRNEQYESVSDLSI